MSGGRSKFSPCRCETHPKGMRVGRYTITLPPTSMDLLLTISIISLQLISQDINGKKKYMWCVPSNRLPKANITLQYYTAMEHLTSTFCDTCGVVTPLYKLLHNVLLVLTAALGSKSASQFYRSMYI